MRWLVRLLTPLDGVVLDPFAGAGSTLEAAKLENRDAVGIELSERHAESCRQRLKTA
jgi:site-specific DNA-methyltransferase (adenine-specific)